LGLFGQKRAFWAFFGPGAQGFYINPSGALPRGRGRPSRAPGAWGPGSPGSGEVSGPPGSRIPGIGVRSPLPPGRGGPGRPRDRSRRPRRVGFYINPSRRGPAVPGRGPGGPESRAGAPRGLRRPPREVLRPPLPREGPARVPREGEPPQGARGGSPPPSGGRASGLGRGPSGQARGRFVKMKDSQYEGAANKTTSIPQRPSCDITLVPSKSGRPQKGRLGGFAVQLPGGYRGAPPRGVDVKPPPGVPEIRDFRPLFGDFAKKGGLGPFLAR